MNQLEGLYFYLNQDIWTILPFKNTCLYVAVLNHNYVNTNRLIEMEEKIL